MTRIPIVTVLAAVLLIASSPASLGQQWSPDELAVWKTIDRCMTEWSKKDIDGVMQFLHDKYSGWRDEQVMPSDKASARRDLAFSFPRFEVTLHDVKPVAITVIGEVAVAHYYYTVAGRLKDGREIANVGRSTSFLVRGDNGWLIVGEQTRTVSQTELAG